jgi:hypothetical protein
MRRSFVGRLAVDAAASLPNIRPVFRFCPGVAAGADLACTGPHRDY